MNMIFLTYKPASRMTGCIRQPIMLKKRSLVLSFFSPYYMTLLNGALVQEKHVFGTNTKHKSNCYYYSTLQWHTLILYYYIVTNGMDGRCEESIE